MESFWLLPVLFATGLTAGFVDSIAGGGGLITLPVLLSLGLTPADALGTNKLQATFGSGSATWHYARASLIDFRSCRVGIVCTAVGATVGTLCVQQIDPEILRRVIPWLLLAIAFYVLVRPRAGMEESKPRLNPGVFHIGFGLLLGFYDGFFGPGTGTFWAMAYLVGLGHNLTRATAHTKVMNFASNLASLASFAASRHVILLAGLTMGLGQLIGARLGSRAVIQRGAPFIRPIFIAVVLAVTVRLLWR
jgi:uncharacterized membrane protein YfcA